VWTIPRPSGRTIEYALTCLRAVVPWGGVTDQLSGTGLFFDTGAMTEDRSSGADLVARIVAATDAVKSDARGLTAELVEARLVAALRERDAFLPMATVRRIARQMSDPWWTVKHPLRAWREARRERQGPDLESARDEAEADELSQRLGGVTGVEVVRSAMTFDGMVHVVTIHPWSDEIANRVRALASPVRVTVEPRH
jgi:hypothetical protein